MKKYLSILILIGLILCTGAGRKAEPIEAKSGELNIEQFEDYEKRYIGEEVQVCSTSSTKSYMDYRAITSRSSAQYKYIREYMLVDETTGFLYDEDGFVGVALGSVYGVIGDRYYITLDSGVVLPVVKIDEKADGDTVNGCAHMSDSSVIEFVIDTDYAKEYFSVYSNGLIASGNYNNYDLFHGKIAMIEEVTEELNENYVEFVEKEEVAFDNYDIFRYASGY